ncbi:MAG: pyridoxamine 5'-phosphate oxidase family protein [bacterium]|nr:pyridoxamine 5'-phosphate oxidase family protein [bacterium]
MKSGDDVIQEIHDLLATQSLGVLATSLAGQPYTSLVAFAASTDLRQVWFVTERATRKYQNVLADARAAMLVDSRSGAHRDFAQAVAVTLTGLVREARAEERATAQAVYLAKHPALQSFAGAPTCALMCLAVQRCLLVRQFQQVQELLFDAVPHA